MPTCLGPSCKTKIDEPFLFCSLVCASRAGCYSDVKGFDIEKCFQLAVSEKRIRTAHKIKRDAENPKYLPSITQEMVDNPPDPLPKTKDDAVSYLMSHLKEIDYEILRRVPHVINLESMEKYSGRAIRMMFKMNDNKELLESCLSKKIDKVTNEEDYAWLAIITDIWQRVRIKKQCKGCQSKEVLHEETEIKKDSILPN